ncbi:MAG: RNA polymerase sigma factor [Pseudonocardiales bacterium]
MDERERPVASPVAPVDPQRRSDVTKRPAERVDDAAFSAFYRQFTPTLVAWLIWQGARLPVAADVAQETMIKAYRNWSTISQPAAWARRVASRELARHIARIEEDPVDDVGERSALLPPLTDVAAWEQQHEVLRVLERLPPRQRQVMAWTLDGYSPAQIADELGITAEAARSSLKKARRTLAAYLRAEGDAR